MKESKIKKILKSDKALIGIFLFIILAVSAFLIIYFCVINKEEPKTKKLHKDTYNMYVKIDSLIKLEFRESYYECRENKKTTICSDKKIELLKYEIVDENENEFYKNLDFKNKNLAEFIANLHDAAVNQEKIVQEIKIFSNYQFDAKKLQEDINELSKSDKKIDIKYYYYDAETVEKLAKENFLEEDKYYTITFDSNGGSNIDSVVVKEKMMLESPQNPTREGYQFVEWQLDDKKYDFNTIITNNITLKAVWKKITVNNNQSGNTNSNNTTTNKPTTNINNGKINLNDGIRVTEYYEKAYSDCGFYVFATNLPVDSSFCPYPKEQCMEDETTEEELANATFDVNKENELINVFKKYSNGTYPGLSKLTYSIENHIVSYDYQYIKFLDSYNSVGETANREIKKILKSAKYLRGPCGAINFQSNKTLDEELCSKYHLDCGRW